MLTRYAREFAPRDMRSEIRQRVRASGIYEKRFQEITLLCARVPMDIFVLKKTPNRGYGLFAARDIHKGEQIFHVDLTFLRKYALDEFEKHLYLLPKTL